MTEPEFQAYYTAKRINIEERANAALASAESKAMVFIGRHGRYASGLGDALRSMAVAGPRAEIEAKMRTELDALDAEMIAFYEAQPNEG